MMIFYFLKRFLLNFFLSSVALICLFTNETQASHAVANSLGYTYVSPNVYKLTLKFYRDCSGISAPTSAIIRYNSTCFPTIAQVTLAQVAGTGLEVAQPCQIVPNTTCTGGTAYGVQEYVYEGTVSLPGVCRDWKFWFEECCRNASINNIVGPGGMSIYVSALLNSVIAPTNSSPGFIYKPVTAFCVNRSFAYNLGATDIDGDSLVYSLVPAQTAAGAPVTYVNPYTATNPFPSSTGIQINSSTGYVTFTPSLQMIAVMCILVQEYRNDSLIGTMKIDMQENITSNCPPITSAASVPYYDASLLPKVFMSCGDSMLTIKFNKNVQCKTVDENGTGFRLFNPRGEMVPIQWARADSCLGWLTKYVTVKFYEPLCLNGSYHLYSKTGNDLNTLISECGSPMREFDTLQLVVLNCFDLPTENKNVSVIENDSVEVIWGRPSGLPPAQFQEYQIHRSASPYGPYQMVGTTVNPDDTVYYDKTADIHGQANNYIIKLKLDNCVLETHSDSIGSIWLGSEPALDTSMLVLSWTNYWKWASPKYVLYMTNSGNNWTALDSTFGNSLLYKKPFITGTYRLKIETADPNSAFKSTSNWLELDIQNYEVAIPNIFSPNGDGVNDFFEIINLAQNPKTRLEIYNIWGRRIYENNEYDNTWDGKNLSAGVYYYIAKLLDGKSLHGTVSIIK